MPKVQMLEQWQRPGFVITGHQELVTEDVIGRAQPWARWVLVGTDNVETRWLVQASWPERLVVAGSAGFMVVVSEHDTTRGCAGCLHAWREEVGGDVPTVSFVSYLGGLMAAARILRWSVAGPTPASEQATEAWADRLDGDHGFRNVGVPRINACPVGCMGERALGTG
jgi:hypothetical protein